MRCFQILLSILVISSQSLAEESLNYISITQGNKVSTSWTIEKENSSLLAESNSSDKSSSKLILSTDFYLKSFEQKEPKKNLTFQAQRDNGTLSAMSKKNEKEKSKTYQIGKTPRNLRCTEGKNHPTRL